MHEQQRDTLIAWLKDAHAMEMTLASELDRQVELLENEMPAMRSKVRAHAEETRRHAEKIEQCLQRYDSAPSGGKEWLGKMSSAIQSMGVSAADDSMVKITLNDFAAENYEIGVYTSLFTAAEALDDMETATVCKEILEDEIAMAEWLEDQIPEVTAQYLERVTE